MPVDQLKRIVASLNPRQRWTILIAAVAVAGGLWGLVHWREESGFVPLYTSLSQEDAAMVVQKLKEGAVPYRISESGASVSVPAERAPELRLEMASAGIPKSGRIGFEIFDKTTFGLTDFAEHVNYRRALEGELERSVMAISEIEQARVHVTFPEDSVFTEARKPAKASVLLKLRPGAHLPDSAIPAVTHLISSAVEGLLPEAVSVLDVRGNLLSRPKRTGDPNDWQSDSALEYQQKVEQDLEAKLDSTLEPLVGAGRFRVAVSAECERSTGEQSEEILDPTRSVMVSSQKTEDVSTSSTSPAASQPGTQGAIGVPGTASALPDPPPPPRNSGGTSRRSENVNYQTSRTVKRMTLPQGGIRRLSVSVLLDHEIHFEGSGANSKRVLTPPTPERLKTIHDLVAAAVGLNEGRGDQLIVESLPFESSLNWEPLPATPAAPPQPPLAKLLNDPKVIGSGAGAVLLIVVVAAFLLKRSASRKARGKVSAAPVLPPSATPPNAIEETTNLPALNPVPIPAVAEVRDFAVSNTDASVAVLRGWLQEDHG